MKHLKLYESFNESKLSDFDPKAHDYVGVENSDGTWGMAYVDKAGKPVDFYAMATKEEVEEFFTNQLKTDSSEMDEATKKKVFNANYPKIAINKQEMRMGKPKSRMLSRSQFAKKEGIPLNSVALDPLYKAYRNRKESK